MACDCNPPCKECKCEEKDPDEIDEDDEPVVEMFGDEFIYRCPHCGEWLPEWVHEKTYSEKDDTIICSGCSFVLKVGDGIRGSDAKNPGDLDGALFLICPVCHSSINEEYIPRLSDEEPDNEDAEGVFVCPACKFQGCHEGGIE